MAAMQDVLNLLLQDEPLTPVQRAALTKDPALCASVQRWLAFRATLRAHLDEALPERRIFVLHALMEAGHADELTEAERTEVAASQGIMTRALEQYPALRDAADRIAEDRAVFMACWEQPVRIRRLTPTAWRIAAAVALIIGFGTVFALFFATNNAETPIAVRDGGLERVQLPDGSIVHLIEEGMLLYDAKDFARHVSVRGNAFFDIVHADAPFTVASPGAVITVLGTRFGIQSDDNSTMVVLESGRVSLAAEHALDQPVLLSPKEMSRVVRGNLPDAPAAVDLAQALHWTGYLFFDATPMFQVSRVLQDRFEVAIAVSEALKDEQVSGTFEPGDDIAYILTTLATTLDAVVERDESAGFIVR